MQTDAGLTLISHLESNHAKHLQKKVKEAAAVVAAHQENLFMILEK